MGSDTRSCIVVFKRSVVCRNSLDQLPEGFQAKHEKLYE